MIKREHIKQAIDAISSRDPDIGYSLDEMLGMGLIDVPPGEDGTEGDNFYFLFDGEKVLINRVLFFNEGIVPIEQGLLIKFGELAGKQELQERADLRAYRDAFKEIHEAGLRTAVTHEVDYAIARLRKKALEEASSQGRRLENLVAFLERLKEQGEPLGITEGVGRFQALYRGVIDVATPACFVKFPVSMDTLMQVADINVDFFHVRFVLDCLIRGMEGNLLACVSDGDILGLVFISLKERIFKKDLEIKYLATLRGKSWAGEKPNDRRLPKGVGTFLVGGVWMLRKNEMPNLREIVLDAELGARPFYEAVGFEARGFFGYVLKEPKGYLLRAILSMTHHCQDLREETAGEIEDLIRKQIKRLRKRAKGQRSEGERRATVAAVLECFKPESKKRFAEAAFQGLMKYRKEIPEAEEMLQFALDHGSDEMKACIAHAASSYR